MLRRDWPVFSRVIPAIYGFASRKDARISLLRASGAIDLRGFTRDSTGRWRAAQ